MKRWLIELGIYAGVEAVLFATGVGLWLLLRDTVSDIALITVPACIAIWVSGKVTPKPQLESTDPLP
jgi:hypothetical protein